MSQKRIEPYWYVIVLLLVVMAGLFGTHLVTGWMPNRVAFAIPVVGLSVYWYGVVIMGGVILGCYVVASLAEQRARRLFTIAVPTAIRKQPIDQLKLDKEIVAILRKAKIQTTGELLYQRGLNPRRLGLSKEGLAVVAAQLQAQQDIDVAWMDDPVWRSWNPEHVWTGVIWCIVFGVIGARLYHVFTPSPSMAAFGIESPADYFRNPEQLINVRNGGLGIYGGIVGGLIGLLLFAWRANISWVRWGDLAVVGLALGQFIGRWGNFFNQELYGRPTDLPWGIAIDHPLAGFESFTNFHPAFLYESLWNLLAFVVLYYLARYREDRLLPGDLIALYLIFYGIGRILLETVRLDSRAIVVGSVALPTASVVSGFIVLAMIVFLIGRRLRKRN
ncbi:MAG: prolipoprotein diacylglyceryl transferase [Anaerolineae bacterium]|nr:prolipoprotein diacylglyceryl transferase [Anaerolineae bacterium]